VAGAAACRVRRGNSYFPSYYTPRTGGPQEMKALSYTAKVARGIMAAAREPKDRE